MNMEKYDSFHELVEMAINSQRQSVPHYKDAAAIGYLQAMLVGSLSVIQSLIDASRLPASEAILMMTLAATDGKAVIKKIEEDAGL